MEQKIEEYEVPLVLVSPNASDLGDSSDVDSSSSSIASIKNKKLLPDKLVRLGPGENCISSDSFLGLV